MNLIQAYKKEVNHLDILDTQIALKNKTNSIYVLSTFPLIVMDYNYENTIEILKEKLKQDFNIINI